MKQDWTILALKNTILRDNEFLILRNLIEDNLGICMTERKKSLVESRLQKRLKELCFSGFDEYCNLLSTPHGYAQELPRLTDAVTTNKTDFFREPEHFHFLENEIIIPRIKNRTNNSTFTFWSSACSSGEEVYTTSIVLETIREIYPRFNYQILGSDISEEILEKAVQGIYDQDKIEMINDNLKKKFFLKGRGQNSQLVKFKNEYSKRVSFSKINLINDISKMTEQFDVIFCRNVMIYFGREVQRKILLDMYDRLKDGGYLMIGHSEFLRGLDLPYIQIGSSIYQKK